MDVTQPLLKMEMDTRLHNERSLSTSDALLSSINYLFGMAFVSIPYATGQAGIFGGILWILYIGTTMFYTADCLCLACEQYPNATTLKDLVQSTHGNTFALVVSLIQCIELFLYLVAFLIVMGASLHEFFPHFSQKVWILSAFTSVLPTIMLWDMSNLSKISLYSIICTFAFFILSIQQDVENIRNVQSLPDIAYISPDSMFFAYSILLANFCIHAIQIETINSMKIQRQSKKVLRYSFGILAPIILAMGVCGYVSFGDDVKSVFQLNWTPHIAKVGSILAFATQYGKFALTLQPISKLFEMWARSSFPSQKTVRYGTLLFRVGVSLIAAVVAIVLPELGTVIAIIGACCMTNVAYVIPLSINARIRGKWIPQDVALCVASVCFGILSIVDIIFTGGDTSSQP